MSNNFENGGLSIKNRSILQNEQKKKNIFN